MEGEGCPTQIRVEGNRIFILDRVEFSTSKDVILERSMSILDEVRAVLALKTQLLKVKIVGHTDSRGWAKRNHDLSRRRARAVARWLVEKGIAAERLEAWGCGPDLPTETNNTNAGRQATRRVEFRIPDPAPEKPDPLPDTCDPIDL